ncbi:MAG: hypothetical protein RLZZ618_4082 [Pseudomonadota bacterium]|jgi:hypothetical protein
MNLPRWLRFVWPAPASAVGLVLAGAGVATGASARCVDGVLEVSGGPMARVLRAMGIVAITLGHVVLGQSAAELDALRVHEHAHVRQYERWGLLFFPLYLAASLLAWCQGQSAYSHNHFERQACAAEAAARRPCARTSAIDSLRSSSP